jgi:hypothetical protein
MFEDLSQPLRVENHATRGVDLHESTALARDMQKLIVYFSTASGSSDRAMLQVAVEIEEPCG